MICKNCGYELPENSKLCMKCGAKQLFDEIESNEEPALSSRKKWKTAALITGIILIIGIIVHCVSYSHAVKYAENANYKEAYEFLKFKTLTSVYDNNFLNYLNAGIMLEDDKLGEALEALKQLGDYRDSAELTMQVQSAAYKEAQTLYRSEKYTESKTLFTALENYERSKDYLTLIEAHVGQYTQEVRAQIRSIIGLEDAGDLVFKDSTSAFEYLEGDSGNGTFIICMSKEGDYYSATWILPGVKSGSWYFEDGYFYTDDAKRCKMKAISSTEYEIYVLATEKTYTFTVYR